jgi:hypothetical protein
MSGFNVHLLISARLHAQHLCHIGCVEQEPDKGLEFLMAASRKMAVFWAVAPYRLIEVYRCFRGSHCLHLQGERHDKFHTEYNSSPMVFVSRRSK